MRLSLLIPAALTPLALADPDYVPTANPSVLDAATNPILTADDALEWILGDPAMIPIPSCPTQMLANEVFHGIIQYKETDSLSNKWSRHGSAVPLPGAVRPNVVVEGDKVFLVYEQYKLTSLFKDSTMKMKTGTISDCEIAWDWGASTILEPTLDWEKDGSSRVGNPFLYKNAATGRYTLYYSAGSVHLDDSNIEEPLHLGSASSDNIEGPYVRDSEEPFVVAGSYDLDGATTIGMGSFKLVKGLSAADGTQQNEWALFNHITLDDATKHTGSTISLARSTDGGKTFSIADADLIAPPLKLDSGWKDTYVYGFDTIADPDDADYVKVFMNGRDGYAHASEAVGVSRLAKSKMK
ncbi:hypothetical protein TeGR_g6831 [Tetraparma gracilis]|uniref:Uncharacterized protein n=1 Tax=Tetraparma gracilis TaxID=2962635 RepID=A0ABQ6MXB6_9STRA|nr:hypothetical protein TeGR_g6831 [Tetraparma gracilis]